MFNKKDFALAKQHGLTLLDETKKSLSSQECPSIDRIEGIDLCKLGEKHIAEKLARIQTGSSRDDKAVDFIYVIQIEPVNKKIVARLKELLYQEREKKTGSAYPSINKGTDGGGTTLYVGRSRSLKTRLKQHLGSGSQSVYALHLENWATNVKCTLTISYLGFPVEGNTPDEHNRLIQAVEDAIWDKLKPQFGRQGSK